jgi:uncharacterized protein YcbK (DUF882 family)
MGDLSEHFSRREFACRCGCGYDVPNQRLLLALEKLRATLGKPIRINSACRCRAHNAKVGGASDSQHVQGNAADIRVRGLSPRDLYYEAIRVPDFDAGGIGVYPRDGFVHVDVRDRRARWGKIGGRFVSIDEALMYGADGD